MTGEAPRNRQDHPDHTVAIGPGATVDLPVLPPEQLEEEAGETLGPFKLVERLGRGTFGSVWRAVRSEPFEQEVAVKIMRKDVASAEGPAAVQARFDLERQVLAQLDHPGIARVFDGGVSERGRNYFVMEFVRGVPITQFCDERRLKLDQRLELFVQVCEAVHYAHQKGVLHRDLKPQNILAYAVEGQLAAGHSPLRVKVIDFGLAKVTMKAGNLRHQFLERGLALGTPEYMSPEQAAGDLSVDARSDIYGLGAVLYDMLISAAPYDRKALRSAGLQAMVRIIRESDPPRPSDRLSSMATAVPTGVASSLDSVSKARGISGKELLEALRRELDLLPMKAMRRNPADRYRSAVELADDVRNYLTGRPLLAAPPSAIYRARKMVRRHRLAVGATVAVALALVAASVVSTVFYLRELHARELAERREAQVRQIAEFQQSMLAQVDPELAGIGLADWMRDRFEAVLKNQGVTASERTARVARLRGDLEDLNPTDIARELIDGAILRPSGVRAGDFLDQPAVEAALKQTLADAYARLGRPKEAEPLQADALRLRRTAFGEGHPATLDSLAGMGRVQLALNGPEAAERPTLEALEARKPFGPLDPGYLDSVLAVARLRAEQGRIEEALVQFEALLKAGVIEESARLSAMASVGDLLNRQGRSGDAVKALQQTLQAVRAAKAPGGDLEVRVLQNLGVAQERLAHARDDQAPDPALLEAALATRLENLAAHERRYGREHAHALRARNDLAVMLWKLRRFEEARSAADLGVQLSGSPGAATREERLFLLNTRANALADLGKVDAAMADMDEAQRLARELEGVDGALADDLLASRVTMLERMGRKVDAIECYRQIVASRTRRLEATRSKPDRIALVDGGKDLGERLAAEGRWREAVDALSQAEVVAQGLPESSQARLGLSVALLETCRGWRKADPAAQIDARIAELERLVPVLKAANEAEAQRQKDAARP